MPNNIIILLDKSEKALPTSNQIKPLKDLEYFYNKFSSEKKKHPKQILEQLLNQLTPSKRESLKKLLPISKHKQIIEQLYHLEDDIMSINESNNLQKKCSPA